MARLTKQQKKVWDRLKNGIPAAVPYPGFDTVFTADGLGLRIHDKSGKVHNYDLSTAWDLSTATAV